MNRRMVKHLLPHPSGEHRALLIHRPALAVYLLLLTLVFLSLNIVKISAPGILGFASNIYVEKIVELTNRERQKNGLTTLKFDPRLGAAAQKKAEDMFADDYWAHIAPDGTTPWVFITDSGYSYVYAGENLAKDFQDSDDVVAAWMNSPTHRKNILNGKYTDIGVAVVNGELDGYETTLVVQMFGAPLPSLAKASEGKPASPITSAPAAAGVAESAKEPATATVPAGSEKSFVTARTGTWQSPVEQSSVQFDVFTFSRTIALTMGGFVALFFVTDEYVAWRRRTVRLSGHALAHAGLLILLLGVAWFLKPGAVL